MSHNIYFACLIGILIVETKAGPASFIKRCKPSDNQCLLSSAQAALPFIIKGIPELGLPPADPLKIDTIRSDDDTLKLGFRNITLYGANTCKIISLLRDLEKNSIKFVLDCTLLGIGQYDISGKVLSVEVDGDGDFNIKTEKIRYTADIKIQNIEKNGKKYWNITEFDFKYDLLEKVHIGLTNLFNGDESKAKPFKVFLDKNWKEAVEQVGTSVYKQTLANLIDVVKNFFLAVPTDELELE